MKTKRVRWWLVTSPITFVSLLYLGWMALSTYAITIINGTNKKAHVVASVYKDKKWTMDLSPKGMQTFHFFANGDSEFLKLEIKYDDQTTTDLFVPKYFTSMCGDSTTIRLTSQGYENLY